MVAVRWQLSHQHRHLAASPRPTFGCRLRSAAAQVSVFRLSPPISLSCNGAEPFEVLEFKRFDGEAATAAAAISALARKSLHDSTPSALRGRAVLLLSDVFRVLQEDGNVGEDTYTLKAGSESMAFLAKAGARVVVAGHWQRNRRLPCDDSRSLRAIADALEAILETPVACASACIGASVKKSIKSMPPGSVLLLPPINKHKEDVSNNAKFARELVEELDVLVNDAFSSCHRALASTVGVAPYVDECMAGFRLHKELQAIDRIVSRTGRPLVAIVGGSQVSTRLPLLRALVEHSDRILAVGPIAPLLAGAYQNESSTWANSAHSESELSSNEVGSFLHYAAKKGLTPCFPSISLTEIGPPSELQGTPEAVASNEGSLPGILSPTTLTCSREVQVARFFKGSRTILWMGAASSPTSLGGKKELKVLAAAVAMHAAQGRCEVVVASREAASLLKEIGVSYQSPHFHYLSGGTALMELLQGRRLPGLAALDLADAAVPVWSEVFADPTLPLSVDIGCGNGVFPLQMAARFRTRRNFLGIEIIQKLVERCVVGAKSLRLPNAHFVSANATHALGPILNSYPGPLSLVAIQCPDPSFARRDDRWRMLQRPLMAAIVRHLQPGGLIFLQSDIEEVTRRMQRMLEGCSRGLVELSSQYHGQGNSYLLENPFDAPTDWEAHVTARGGPMYRVMYVKLDSALEQDSVT